MHTWCVGGRAYCVAATCTGRSWPQALCGQSRGFFSLLRHPLTLLTRFTPPPTHTHTHTHTHTPPAPQLIVHLAARAGVRPSIDDPFLYLHSNSEATLRIFELARKFAVPHLAVASSSSVYGGSKKECFSEKDRVDRPVSPYAATKKATEEMAYCYHHLYGISVTMLRFFTVYGPRGRPDMAPYKFLHRIINGITIDQYGDGTSERDYTYIDDIVDGVVRSLDRPLGYEVFNIGNGRPISLKAFITEVERQAGVKANINLMPMQPGDVMRTCADISHARELLGYNPSTPLEVGLGHTVRWLREWMASKKAAAEAGVVETETETFTAAVSFEEVAAKATKAAKVAKVAVTVDTAAPPASYAAEEKEADAPVPSTEPLPSGSTEASSSGSDEDDSESDPFHAAEFALDTPTSSSSSATSSEGEADDHLMDDASSSSGTEGDHMMEGVRIAQSRTSTQVGLRGEQSANLAALIAARRAGRKIVVGTRIHRLTSGGRGNGGGDIARLHDFLVRVLQIAAPTAERAMENTATEHPGAGVGGGGMVGGTNVMQRRAVEAREGSRKGKVAAADVIEVTVAVHTGPGSNAGGADLLGEIMNMVGGRVGASLGEDALEVVLPAGASAHAGPRYVTKSGVTIQLLPIFQWGKFTPALNALLSRAKDIEAEGIVYASAEARFTRSALDALTDEVFPVQDGEEEERETTLVAGACFEGHHAFDDASGGRASGSTPVRLPLSGLTTPWNTLAMWRVGLLGLVGFPPIAEGVPGTGVQGGVEEVSVVAMLQTLCGLGGAEAKLLRFGPDDVSVFTNFAPKVGQEGATDAEVDPTAASRAAWHDTKMRSKTSRAAAQVELLQRSTAVTAGSVIHIDTRSRRTSL
jgi:UDP-glucuronate 4-epimerase